MATTRRSATKRTVEYPTSDGKPMAETDVHRKDMVDLIATLDDYFATDPQVYVSGNLLLFYEEGNRRKHIAPDVLVVRGVPKLPLRKYYLLWEEGQGPDLVIELTSKTTRREDREKKLVLYRDRLAGPRILPLRSLRGVPQAVVAGLPPGGGSIRRDRVGGGSAAQRDARSAPGASRRRIAAIRPGDRALSADTAGTGGRRGRGPTACGRGPAA